MSSPALLLFLELEGVLVLNGSTKRALIADAIRTIAAGEYKWRDYQELWEELFDPEPRGCPEFCVNGASVKSWASSLQTGW